MKCIYEVSDLQPGKQVKWPSGSKSVILATNFFDLRGTVYYLSNEGWIYISKEDWTTLDEIANTINKLKGELI